MKKILLYILTSLGVLACQTADKTEKLNTDSTIEKKEREYFDITLQDITSSKYNLDNILFQDSWAFYKASKDTLLVFFEKSLMSCGNAPAPLQFLDSRPLFENIKIKALKYGFKTVIADTIPFEELLGTYDLERLEKIPFYKIAICPTAKNKVTIFQSYVSGKDKIDINKDSTITL